MLPGDGLEKLFCQFIVPIAYIQETFPGVSRIAPLRNIAYLVIDKYLIVSYNIDIQKEVTKKTHKEVSVMRVKAPF